MSITTIAVHETSARAYTAAGLAAYFELLGYSDAREATPAEWDAAPFEAPSRLTKAATVAVMDVLHGRVNENYGGAKAANIAYNTARLGTLLAEVLYEGGAREDTGLTAHQWDLARRIVASASRPVQELSGSVKESALSILEVMAQVDTDRAGMKAHRLAA